MANTSGKTKAVVAYLTFIGLLVAFYLNKEKKDDFATWHIKNMFGLLLFMFAAVAMQGYAFGIYFYWGTVLFWLISILSALLDKRQGIPYLSEKFQSWFTFLD
ncbi:MAG: hypothetical protein AAF466_08830 [Bacteroidota bacterium]